MAIEIIPSEIDAYIESYYSESDPVLRDMEALAASRGFPIVGPQVGRALFLLARLARAQRIFEIGSGFGYSAYWFARALPEGGKVYQTESSKENSSKAKGFFKRAGFESKSEFLVGDGIRLIDQIGGEFDIVLIDADKEDYPKAFAQAKRHLKKGGLLIADNLLWSGRVVGKVFGKTVIPVAEEDEETRGIKQATKMLFEDPDFFAAILPIRDGVGVGYRK